MREKVALGIRLMSDVEYCNDVLSLSNVLTQGTCEPCTVSLSNQEGSRLLRVNWK